MAITLKGLLTLTPPTPGPGYSTIVFTGNNLLTVDQMNDNFFYLRELALRIGLWIYRLGRNNQINQLYLAKNISESVPNS
jgi:hypothetical protein